MAFITQQFSDRASRAFGNVTGLIVSVWVCSLFLALAAWLANIGRDLLGSDRQQQRGERADRIRDELQNHYDHGHLLDDFWANNPNAPYRFHQNSA